MTNTSATGGLLLGFPCPVFSDDMIESELRSTFAQITNLPLAHIWPRLPENHAVRPDTATTWMALGAIRWIPDATPAIRQDSIDSSKVVLSRTLEFEQQVFCYGPAAAGYVFQLVNALTIPQNMEVLSRHGFVFVNMEIARSMTERIDDMSYNQCECLLKFRLSMTQRFSIFNLLAAPVNVTKE